MAVASCMQICTLSHVTEAVYVHSVFCVSFFSLFSLLALSLSRSLARALSRSLALSLSHSVFIISLSLYLQATDVSGAAYREKMKEEKKVCVRTWREFHPSPSSLSFLSSLSLLSPFIGESHLFATFPVYTFLSFTDFFTSISRTFSCVSVYVSVSSSVSLSVSVCLYVLCLCPRLCVCLN
jgi:hypothetical protein